jgi:hypothetical protein
MPVLAEGGTGFSRMVAWRLAEGGLASRGGWHWRLASARRSGGWNWHFSHVSRQHGQPPSRRFGGLPCMRHFHIRRRLAKQPWLAATPPTWEKAIASHGGAY